MLFVTNRSIRERERAAGTRPMSERRIHFDTRDNFAGQAVYFCRRDGADDYVEVGGLAFMQALKEAQRRQVLLYFHGFSNQPEPDIFPRAELLQRLFDAIDPLLVSVVPVIWPCDNDIGIVKDYWDDQKSADASAFAFARALEKFLAWQTGNAENDDSCLKRLNVLAHSMGNRVLRATLSCWSRYDRGGALPLLFRNVFMVAADVVNETLARGGEGEPITVSARNVVVYHASDDLALRASKVSNLKNGVASRRLGHTGPEDMRRVPGNVYAIDCDDVNTLYDPPKGHSYFLLDPQQSDVAGGRLVAGKVFAHIAAAVQSGRVPLDDAVRRIAVLRG